MNLIQQPYARIIEDSYRHYISPDKITNDSLRHYFNECFAQTVDYFSIYACWACVTCIARNSPTNGWGTKPLRCPTCGTKNTYQISTFNSWASRVGKAFSAAALQLLREAFRIPIYETPGNTTTHDYEVSSSVAIEAKGSPSEVHNPDGSVYKLDRPGMERSDTEKKAFANASTFKRRNPQAYFGILTNAMPARLLNYRNDVVNGIFNLTRHEEIQVFVRDLEERVDLNALRRRSFP